MLLLTEWPPVVVQDTFSGFVYTMLPTFRTMDDWYVLTDMIENMLITAWLLIVVQNTTDCFAFSIPRVFPVMIRLRDAIEVMYIPVCCY
jgi:hypothetical protein